MRKSAKKKRKPVASKKSKLKAGKSIRKRKPVAAKRKVNAVKPERPQSVKERDLEAEEIRRAVEDGMQDLRFRNP